MAREGFFVAADGVRLYWRAVGDGPTVVLPNGTYFVDDLEPLARRWTLLAYDARNRGRSDAVTDPAALGIERDVTDLEAMRRALGLERLALVGHSYAGVLLALYGQRHPGRVERLVLIGPPPPDSGKEYPPERRCEDGVAAAVFARVGEVQRASADLDGEERCRRVWEALAPLYVADPSHAARVARWGRCELPNERGFLRYWTSILLPSIQARDLSAPSLAGVAAPTLVVHGRRDRSAPWGGGADWAARLPRGRLLAIEDAGHAPWLEAPERVLPAIERFLAGEG